MSIFTSPNNIQENEYMIEATLLEDEVLNEQIAFKFVKKDDVPEDFKKFASKLVGELEEACSKKKLAGTGIWAASMAQSFGIRFGKVKEKIEKKSAKNLYTIFVPYKGILNAVGEKPKVMDSFFGSPKLMKDYVEGCFKKAGMKRVSSKIGAYDGYWKQGKDCIYAADCVATTGDGCTIYIRCVLDTPENKEVLAGGKRFTEASIGIFSECLFLEDSFDDLNKAKKNFWDNHNARMKELNQSLSKINNDDDDKKYKEMQDKNRKDLDDLLK